MKKISKLLKFLGLGLASLIAFGCSDVDEDSSVSSDVSRTSAKDYIVQAFYKDTNTPATGFFANSSSSSRTIMSKTALDSGDFDYYIWGTNVGTTVNVSPRKVAATEDSSDSSKAQVTIDLTPATYNLALAAVPSTGNTLGDAPAVADVKSAATLIGYANADLTSATAINFFISSDGLSGNATLELTLKPGSGWDITGDARTDSSNVVTSASASNDKYVMSVKITERGTDNIVSGTDTTSSFNGTFSGVFGSSSTLQYKNSVKAGTYDFVVTLLDEAASKSYEWSDIIIILPNQELEQDVIIPYIIGKTPPEPDYFYVSYNTDGVGIDSDEYNLVFNFGYASNTANRGLAQRYEIDIAPVSDDTEPLAGPWANIGTGSITTWKSSDYGDVTKGWVAGHLSRNSTGIVIKTKLAKAYLARIRANNAAGYSKYVYVTFWTSSATDNASTGTAQDVQASVTDNIKAGGKTYTGTEFSSYKMTSNYVNTSGVITPAIFDTTTAVKPSTINLVRISYDLNGGELSGAFKDGTNVETTNQTKNFDIFTSFASLDTLPGVPILSPTGDFSSIALSGAMTNDTSTTPSKNISISKSGKKWYGWKKDNSLYGVEGTTGGTPSVKYCYPEPITTLQNIYLVADYSSVAGVQILDPSKYDIKSGTLNISGTGVKDSSGTAITALINGGTSTIVDSITTDTTAFSLSWTYPSTPTFTYSSMSLSIRETQAGGKTVLNGLFNSSGNINIPAGTLSSSCGYTATVHAVYSGIDYSYTFYIDCE